MFGKEKQEKRSHEMSDVHFMAPFNDYITCQTALFRIPGSDKFHGWYGTGRNQKSSFPIRKEVKSNERTSWPPPSRCRTTFTIMNTLFYTYSTTGKIIKLSSLLDGDILWDISNKVYGKWWDGSAGCGRKLYNLAALVELHPFLPHSRHPSPTGRSKPSAIIQCR